MNDVEARTAAEQALAELSKLGTVEAVATWLDGQGIGGQPRMPRNCPVVRLLRKVTGRAWMVSDSTAFLYARESDTEGGVPVLYIPTPELVRRFIIAIDFGRTPWPPRQGESHD